MWNAEQAAARRLSACTRPRSTRGNRLVWALALTVIPGTEDVAFSRIHGEGTRPPDGNRRVDRVDARTAASPTASQPADATGKQAHGSTDADSSGLRWFWKDTVRIESPDKNFRLKLGGRFQGDWAVFDTRHDLEEEVADFEEGTEVRRARVYYSGTLYKHFEFKTQIDLTERNIEAKDVYVGLIDHWAIGNLRFGHFKEPFGLNELTSSKYIMFLERSQTTETFAPGRNTGIMLHDTALDERATWAVGFFRETDEFFNGEVSDGLHLTGRVTALPWYEEEGRKLVHLGVAWSHQDPGGDDIGFDARPESHLAPKLADSDDMTADRVDVIGVEAALVCGSFSVQGEYIQAFVNRGEGSDLEFNSFYVQGSYIFTGEHRHYATDVAEFGRIRPQRNFGDDGGMGAWEVAVRYSYLDLNDEDLRGGRVSDVSAGLNWYVDPNVRVSWNYVHSNAHDSGFANIFQMRLQVAF